MAITKTAGGEETTLCAYPSKCHKKTTNLTKLSSSHLSSTKTEDGNKNRAAIGAPTYLHRSLMYYMHHTEQGVETAANRNRESARRSVRLGVLTGRANTHQAFPRSCRGSCHVVPNLRYIRCCWPRALVFTTDRHPAAATHTTKQKKTALSDKRNTAVGMGSHRSETSLPPIVGSKEVGLQ